MTNSSVVAKYSRWLLLMHVTCRFQSGQQPRNWEQNEDGIPTSGKVALAEQLDSGTLVYAPLALSSITPFASLICISSGFISKVPPFVAKLGTRALSSSREGLPSCPIERTLLFQRENTYTSIITLRGDTWHHKSQSDPLESMQRNRGDTMGASSPKETAHPPFIKELLSV